MLKVNRSIVRWTGIKVSEMTAGFSGADLENMLNEAAILTARKDKKKIVMEDIEKRQQKLS